MAGAGVITESEIQEALNGSEYFDCPAGVNGVRMKKSVCVIRQTVGIRRSAWKLYYIPERCKDCQIGRDILKEVKDMEDQKGMELEDNHQASIEQENVASKVCNKCKQTKPLDGFPKNKECKDGHEGQCKKCKSAHTRERMKKKRKAEKAGTINQGKRRKAGPALPGHPRFYELVKEMARIHSEKNQDYGSGDPLGNFREAEKLGIEPWRGSLIRLSDKYSRVTSLAGGREAKVKDESIKDTLLDLANYAVLTIVLMEESGLNDA